MVIGGRYEVVREIGAGGMGQVFEVRHTSIGRRFALKIIRVGNVDDEVVRRFKREARALALVESPRVAQVTDFDVEESIGPYLVMEFVPGPTLEERINDTTTFQDVATLAADTAEALADIHEAGLVHRDIKPANLAIGTHPVPVKLLDFGLATSVDDSYITRITQSQQVLGSLPYLAPEQFAGQRPKPAQDLWALGIMMYEMAVGALPFVGSSTAAVMHRILTAPPPVSGEVPDALWAIINELLTKDPELRPSNARALAARLRAIDPAELIGAPKLRAATFQEGNQPEASEAASGVFGSRTASVQPQKAPAVSQITSDTLVISGARPVVRAFAVGVVALGILLAAAIIYLNRDDAPEIRPILPGTGITEIAGEAQTLPANEATPVEPRVEVEPSGSEIASAGESSVGADTNEDVDEPTRRRAVARQARVREEREATRQAAEQWEQAAQLIEEEATVLEAEQEGVEEESTSGSQDSSDMSEWGGGLLR